MESAVSFTKCTVTVLFLQLVIWNVQYRYCPESRKVQQLVPQTVQSLYSRSWLLNCTLKIRFVQILFRRRESTVKVAWYTPTILFSIASEMGCNIQLVIKKLEDTGDVASYTVSLLNCKRGRKLGSTDTGQQAG